MYVDFCLLLDLTAEDRDVAYNYRFIQSKCQIWDEETQTWETANCDVNLNIIIMYITYYY